MPHPATRVNTLYKSTICEFIIYSVDCKYRLLALEPFSLNTRAYIPIRIHSDFR